MKIIKKKNENKKFNDLEVGQVFSFKPEHKNSIEKFYMLCKFENRKYFLNLENGEFFKVMSLHGPLEITIYKTQTTIEPVFY